MSFKNNTEKEFTESIILKHLERAAELFLNYSFFMAEIADPDIEDHTETLREYASLFCREARSLQRAVSMYLEAIGHTIDLNEFKLNLITGFNTDGKLLAAFDEYESEDYRSLFVTKVYDFIAPYQFTQKAHLDLLLQNKGLEYLDRILRNTQVIIEHDAKNPKTETQVYKAVKFYLTTVIPSAESPTAVFKKQFNTYAPDIVLPELASAVEYKYVNSYASLASIISGILADTKSYTGNSEYRFFYAVFYLTSSFISFDEFEHLWGSFDIPVNWKPIFVIGRSY